MTMPNLEQVGLLQIRYEDLDEIAADAAVWSGRHESDLYWRAAASVSKSASTLFGRCCVWPTTRPSSARSANSAEFAARLC